MTRPLASLLPQNPRIWLLFAALVAVMQFSDPLGDVSLGDATLFWGGRLAGVAISLVMAHWLVARLLPAQLNSPPWLKPVVLTIVIAVIPMTLVEIALETAIPQNAAFDDSDLREQAPLLAALTEYLTILSIVLPINALLWVVLDRRTTVGESDSTQSPPEFLRKARGVSVDDVIALSAEGHYVNVVTQQGKELIYCKFRDAINAMPKSIGTQVHRSWWVADAAVVSAVRGERRYQLELPNGEMIPVSDRFLPTVRARGMIVGSRSNLAG
ncbi:MAG: LytTR family DNA-binding domain-containing protein [Woeseiaceae bacterium]